MNKKVSLELNKRFFSRLIIKKLKMQNGITMATTVSKVAPILDVKYKNADIYSVIEGICLHLSHDQQLELAAILR